MKEKTLAINQEIYCIPFRKIFILTLKLHYVIVMSTHLENSIFVFGENSEKIKSNWNVQEWIVIGRRVEQLNKIFKKRFSPGAINFEIADP